MSPSESKTQTPSSVLFFLGGGGNHRIPTGGLKRGRAARNLAHLFHTWRLKGDEAPLVHSSPLLSSASDSFRPTPKTSPGLGGRWGCGGVFHGLTYDGADDRERKLPQQITKAANRMFQKHQRRQQSSNNPAFSMRLNRITQENKKTIKNMIETLTEPVTEVPQG